MSARSGGGGGSRWTVAWRVGRERLGKFAESAMCFVRVFHVYPNKQELVMIVQQSMPEPVFVAFVELLQREVRVQPSPACARLKRCADWAPPGSFL